MLIHIDIICSDKFTKNISDDVKQRCSCIGPLDSSKTFGITSIIRCNVQGAKLSNVLASLAGVLPTTAM